MSPSCRDALRVEFENNNGGSVDRQSLLFNLSQIRGGGGRKYWENSEVFRCASGNEALADHLKDHIVRAGGKVTKNAAVTRIDVDETGGVDITYGPKRNTKHFDVAILAIPPSMWSRGLSIGPGFQASRYRVTMGKAVKYLSPLKRRFWLDSKLAPSSSSDQYGMTWEGTDNQVQRKGDTVELSLFAGGKAAAGALRARNPHAFYSSLLSEVYPGYSRNVDRKKAVFVPWPREKWTRSGYSCLRPGEVTLQAQNMSVPFKGRLHFAGEHTCPAFYGYMEGALHSGFRSGKTILLGSGWRKRKRSQAGRSGKKGLTAGMSFVERAQLPSLFQALLDRWDL